MKSKKHTNMNKYIAPIVFVLTSILLISCEETLNTDSDTDTAAQLEGQWKCDETSTFYKSAPGLKAAERIYFVNIFQLGSDSTTIRIDNFYELGENVVASAVVNGNTITLNREELDGGFAIRGSGTLSQNLRSINWLYYVDDGSGEEDEVSATYTLVY